MIYKLVETLSTMPKFPSEAAAQSFLSQYPLSTQAQLISAMYIGRDHLHTDNFSEEAAPHTSRDGLIRYCDHIDPKEFARILHEKADNVPHYFQRFDVCAKAAGLV